MTLNEAEVDIIKSKITGRLAATEYASTLSLVPGGTTNLVFRGRLKRRFAEPGETPVESVVVKHVLSFARLNKSLPLDTTRAAVESSALEALNNVSRSGAIGTVRVPRLLLFDETTSTQVLEDLASAVDLKTILVSPDNETILLPSAGLYVGQNLGVWLRGFHEWTSVPAQDEFRELVAKNRAMQELKHRLACNGALKAAQDFPELFDDNMEWAKQVEEASAKELEQSLSNSNNDWGVIHGDFWTGNILVQNNEASNTTDVAVARLSVIDWEFCQLGHRSHDIGQMIACLYERHHFNGAEGAMTAIQGFLQGYGEMSDEMALKTAFRMGVYMVGWYTRRAPDSAIPHSAHMIRKWLEMGRDFVLKALARDQDWFLEIWLRSLFQSK